MCILKLVAMDIVWWHSNSFKTCEGKRSTRLVENLLLTSHGHGTHPLPGYMSPKREHSDVQRLFSLSMLIIIFHFKSFHFGGVHRVQSMSPSLASLLNIVAQFGMGVVSPRVVRIEGLIAMASQHLLRSSEAEVQSRMFQGELLHEMGPPLLSRSS